jgi:autotransporter-associated beta strand protein
MSVSVGAQVNGGTLLINAPGLLIANGGLWIAQNVSTGACVVNTGTLIVSNAIAVGRNNAAANGTLTLNFGSIQKYGPGNITVGALNGNGTLTVNGGSLINNGQLVLAEGAGGGLFNLNGGVVQASLLTGFGSALAVARFNGGTLQATTNNPTFIVNLGQALVQSGGFILDDGGYAVTNFQALLQDATSPGGGFTKKGAGIVGLNSANTFRGDSRINAGVLRLVNGAALQFSTLNLAPTDSGTLSFGSLTAATLGGLSGSRGLALSNDFATAVALSVGNNTSNTAYTGILSGNGSVNKIGPGTLTLSGTNNYSGITTVSSGVLLVHRTLGPGAVSVTGGVLGGNGTLAGAVTVQPGGTLSPGSSIGVLTISNSVNLTGTTFMEITHVGPTNDALNVSGTLMRGGALIVTNIGPALVAGDTFPLFNAASFAGSFANLTLPALNSGLRWNTNLFATTGVISVANITAPQIRPSLNGTNFVVQFPTEAGVTYVLQATPTLYTPITWTPQRTNSGDGTFQSMSIPIDPAQSQRYFRLQAF